MKKWSYQLVLATFSICLFMFSSSLEKVWAYHPFNCGSCWDPFSFGGFEAGGEFLWWKLCTNELKYAICKKEVFLGDRPHKKSIETLRTDWGPGGRGWLYIPCLLCGEWGMGGSWTGLWTNDSTRTFIDRYSPKFCIIPRSIDPKFPWKKVSARWKVNYQDYDVLMSYPYGGSYGVFQPFCGFAGIIFDQKIKLKGERFRIIDLDETVRGTPSDELKIKWTSKLCAYGARLGAKYEFDILSCFSVYGKASFSLLAGRPDTIKEQKRCRERRRGDNQNGRRLELVRRVRLKGNERYRAYPGYDLAAGFVCKTCFCLMDFSGRLGYEFVQWYNFPGHRNFIEHKRDHKHFDAAGSKHRTFTWHGITVGLSAWF